MEETVFQERTDLKALNEAVLSIRNEIKKVIVGQDEMVRLIVAALLADGHVLIEGVPGVAKTLTAKLVARSVDAGFSRIQFTPDLMPSDVLGTPVFNPKEAGFESVFREPRFCIVNSLRIRHPVQKLKACTGSVHNPGNKFPFSSQGFYDPPCHDITCRWFSQNPVNHSSDV